MTVENVISNYRILTQLFRSPSCSFYLAEDTTGSAPLSIVILWPIITLTGNTEQDEFLQKARGGTIQCQGKTVAIRDAGLQDQHPYIVTASSYEIRDLLEQQIKILDHILQKMQKNYPGDQRVLLNTLLYAFITPAPLNAQSAFAPSTPITPAPVESKPVAPQLPETPVPPLVENDDADEVFVFPIQESLIPTLRSSSSNTSEPTLMSTNNVSEEIENPFEEGEPTLRSANSLLQEAVYPPSVTPEPTVRSANSPSQEVTNSLPNTSEPTLSNMQQPVLPVYPDETWRIAKKSAPQEQPLPFGAPIGTVRPKKGWRPNKWQIGVAAVLLLLLLAWGINTLHTTLPATNATVTIQPMSKEINKTYVINVSAQNSTGPLTVKGRALAASSRQLVQTVPATGRGHHDAVSATGVIVVSQINLTNSNGNDMLNLSIGDNNGVTANGDEPVHIYTGGVVSIPSHASPAGSIGNIAAHDMDGPIQILDHYTRAVIGTAYISNPNPFTGGVDARDYSYVRQSDIDKATNVMVSQLTAGTKTQVKKQIKNGELLTQDPSCTQNVSSNRKVEDEATDVTVKVSLNCSALAYPDHALQDAAQKAYTTDGNTLLGTGYGVVGKMVFGQPHLLATGDSFSITVDGIWSFQYTDQSQQKLKQSISGKPLNDALQMLQARKDIKTVSLATSGGFGTAVPTTLIKIKLVISKVNGL